MKLSTVQLVMLDKKLETSLPDIGPGNLINMHSYSANIHYFVEVFLLSTKCFI